MVNVPWCHDCDKPDGLCKCLPKHESTDMTPDFTALKEATEKILELRKQSHLPPSERTGNIWETLNTFSNLATPETILSLLNALTVSSDMEKYAESIEDKHDLIKLLRYSNQDIDRENYAKVKLTCWNAHIEMQRLRTELTDLETKLEKAGKALEPFAEIFTGVLDDSVQLPTVRPVDAFRQAAKTLKEITSV